MKIPRDEFFSVPELRERGWTDAIIQRLLPLPDDTRPNPRFKSASPMKMFRRDRVIAIETTPEFQSAKAGLPSRKDASKRAVETKRKRILEWVNTLVIKVPTMEADELIRQSVDHYNLRGDTRPYRVQMDPENDYCWRPATVNSDPSFLDRISVNYLRHRLTEYEKLLRKTFGKVGTVEACAAIRARVLYAIGLAYPHLAEECDQQVQVGEARQWKQTGPW